MWNILRIFVYNKQTINFKTKTAIMAKKIKSRVEYQVTELVNNLTEANTTQSEQKRDFYTSKALYNAKRLSTLVSNAKIGALTVLLAVGMASCGSASTEAKSDSTAVAVDSAVATTDTTAAPVATDSVAK
jgi:thiol:disulfide interchange protein